MKIFTTINKNDKSIFWLFAIGLLGILTAKLGSSFATLVGLLVLTVGFIQTLVTRNKNGAAHLFSAFIIGSAVFYRMAGASLPWEFEKYAVIILLSTGILLDSKKRSMPFIILIYFLLLLPASYLTFDYYSDFIEARKKVTFNLSGPLTLLIATLYFYKLKISLDDFSKISYWTIAGIFMMSTYLFLKVGDYTAISFSFGSNMDASGGFSGNQVSSIYGLGIVLLGIHFILKKQLLNYFWLEWGMMGLFLFQGLMTFSRGGILGAILSLIIGGVIYYLSNLRQFFIFIKGNFIKMFLLVIFVIGGFIFTDQVTGGFLKKRYFNVDEYGQQIKEDYTTQRADFMMSDLKLMKNSDYLGVGPGVGFDERKRYLGHVGAAHTEYSRMLAEHGILGLFSLVFLLYFPLVRFFKLHKLHDTRLIFTVFILYSLITMTHAAMRLGMVGFLFGMAFIIITDDNFRMQKDKNC